MSEGGFSLAKAQKIGKGSKTEILAGKRINKRWKASKHDF